MFLVYRLQILKNKQDNIYQQLRGFSREVKNKQAFQSSDYNQLFNLYDLSDEQRIKKLM